MAITLEKLEGEAVLRLTGDLTFASAVELRSNLIRAIEEVEYLTLDVSNVKEVDISCLQLFCSAHRVAAVFNKKLVIRDHIPATIKKAIEDEGFFRHMVCIYACDDKCLWRQKNGCPGR